MISGRFEGKVAFITGAARGQGRAHAVRFAQEGADIIAIDLCRQLDSVAYALSTLEDLDETVRLVESTGRRIIAEQADVRDLAQLEVVVDNAVGEFGRIDYVLANAGIGPVFGDESRQLAAYLDSIGVMLNGVYFTIEAALPALLRHGDGGAVVITSSAAGLKSVGRGFATKSHGGAGYTAAKHGVVGLMRYYATTLAERGIRVNSVHPTGVATPMIQNPEVEQYITKHPEFGAALENLLPVPMVECLDVTEAMVYLCSDAGRYLTGVTLPVDAGLTAK
ncbi:mycofactocin-coupled SDR family oxidoreductase [Mycolicibacter sinensis]|uniref:3-ketoacyl-ACP reductase n=1 Tax=Mycolicibacter sinensis (strain JDM601) TaxID=875328 RepID=A0A1A3TWC5_MYCSD|nr:mycofactocin-coupled SDR family oxidoreductase [Mycolicibacter sinensis]OBK86946.1 3-ketoacyl-ACP reductase [Mycolicibacter sinensis]